MQSTKATRNTHIEELIAELFIFCPPADDHDREKTVLPG
jgi:hypothetical protein